MADKKILIVEDDLFLREIYTDSLNVQGYNIETAIDGDEASSKLKKGGWDLVLLDIRLPKITSFEVIDVLKKDPGFQTPPIIFLTGIDNESDIKRALEIGIGYLIKSEITPGDLVKEVDMFFSKKTLN